ncbi:hypothetical protein GH733_012022 [Mirounga leonina]|nr:hypothetical protein GH733_012022 [Mirounga leonina]
MKYADIDERRICYVLNEGSKETKDIFYFSVEDNGVSNANEKRATADEWTALLYSQLFRKNLVINYMAKHEPHLMENSILVGPAQPGAGGDVRQDLRLLASKTEGPILTWRPDNIFQTARFPSYFLIEVQNFVYAKSYINWNPDSALLLTIH